MRFIGRGQEKEAKNREKDSGTTQRSRGGLPPRKRLSTWVRGNRLQQPSSRERLRQRRREALQQAVSSSLDEEKENLPSNDRIVTANETPVCSDDEPRVHESAYSDDLLAEFLGETSLTTKSTSSGRSVEQRNPDQTIGPVSSSSEKINKDDKGGLSQISNTE